MPPGGLSLVQAVTYATAFVTQMATKSHPRSILMTSAALTAIPSGTGDKGDSLNAWVFLAACALAMLRSAPTKPHCLVFPTLLHCGNKNHEPCSSFPSVIHLWLCLQMVKRAR